MQTRLIAAATDFSPSADQAVARALALAERRGARLLVAHVFPPVVNSSPLWEKVSGRETEKALRGVAERLKEASRQELERRYLSRAGSTRAEGVYLEGKVVRGLVDLVRERGVDLLVLGAVGAGGQDRPLLGSVAARLLRKAPCPVLVVRARARA